MPNYKSDSNDVSKRTYRSQIKKTKKHECLISVKITSECPVRKSPLKGLSSQKFTSQHVSADKIILSPNNQHENSPKKPPSSSKKFFSQHLSADEIILSPNNQHANSPKRPSNTSKKFFSQHASADEIILSPNNQHDNSPKIPSNTSKKYNSPKNFKNNLSKMSGHVIKKQLFKSKESSSTHSTPKDQFKELILHNLLVLKQSVRDINEKLSLILERQISHNYVQESSDLTLDYSNLNCLLPINEEDILNNIEEQLAIDKKYHASLTKQLAGLGGKSIKTMVKRIMGYLFTDYILSLYSLNGRANKKNVLQIY